MTKLQQSQQILTSIPDIVQNTASSFEEIRQQLITFMSGQEEFKDYNYEGSRLAKLIDLLAYNTMYIQQFQTAAQFESWIQTATQRSQVVASAQDNMGYLPSSYSAAQLSVRVGLTHKLQPAVVQIPKGTKFIGVVKNTDSYDFCTWENATLLKDDESKYYATLKLVQGRIIQNKFVFEKNGRIVIEDKFIDRNYIRVYVDGALWTNWTNDQIVNTTGDQTVYYLRENYFGQTEIYFGEGEEEEIDGYQVDHYVGGKRPQIGQIITVEYISTDGPEANGAKDFSYVDSLSYVEMFLLEENPTKQKNYTGADGGGLPEDIERIRTSAPIFQEAQKRCVTSSDYVQFIHKKFGNIIQAAEAFTDSQKPGYAFISLKPKSGLTLTEVQKDDIKAYLEKYNLGPITPIVMSPNYIHIKHNIKVSYKLGKMPESEEWLKGQVMKSIDRYYTENVESFGKSFHTSKLMKYIDDTHYSILGQTCDIQMVREIDNYFKSPASGIVFYNNIKGSDLKQNKVKYKGKSITYDQFYQLQKSTSNNKTKLIFGPFYSDDTPKTGQEYTGTDIDRSLPGKYYEVGYFDHIKNTLHYDLGQLNVDSQNYISQYIEFYATPKDENIYQNNGQLIVFENDLRPQYTKIVMEPIQ